MPIETELKLRITLQHPWVGLARQGVTRQTMFRCVKMSGYAMKPLTRPT